MSYKPEFMPGERLVPVDDSIEKKYSDTESLMEQVREKTVFAIRDLNAWVQLGKRFNCESPAELEELVVKLRAGVHDYTQKELRRVRQEEFLYEGLNPADYWQEKAHVAEGASCRSSDANDDDTRQYYRGRASAFREIENFYRSSYFGPASGQGPNSPTAAVVPPPGGESTGPEPVGLKSLESSRRPTEPGWYWYENDAHGGGRCVVDVYIDNNTDKLMFAYHGQSLPIDYFVGPTFWRGPLK